MFFCNEVFAKQKYTKLAGHYYYWQPLDQGGAMGGSVAHPTLSKVKSKIGVEGR